MSSAAGKIRLGYYSDTLSLGGSEVYLRQILQSVDKVRYHIVLFIPQRHPLSDFAQAQKDIEVLFLDGETQKENDSSGKAVIEKDDAKASSAKQFLRQVVPSSVKLLVGTFKDIRRLKKIFRDHPVELLHFNDTGCEPPVIAARLAGIKKIIGTYHVLPSYEQKGGGWVHRLIEHLSVRCLNVGIAVSEATKIAWSRRTGVDLSKIKVIYNGIDLKKFIASTSSEGLREKLNLNGKTVVGVLARLHPMKGHRYLIEVLPQIKEKFSDLKVLFVGDGPLRQELERQTQQLNLKDTVLFLGHCENIPAYLSLFDVMVLPSVSLETFGFTLVEAMAMNKPVVASNFSGIPEVVQDGVTGILVPPQNPPALAEAVIRLLSDRRIAEEMGRAGRKRVEELFTEERMLRETFQLYDEFLDAKRN